MSNMTWVFYKHETGVVNAKARMWDPEIPQIGSIYSLARPMWEVNTPGQR